MVRRLHFYAGLLVGPFILVAALTGALYAAAPQIEKVVYHHQLTTESSGPSLPLDQQVSRAVAYVDAHDGIHDASRKVLSVRPAPGAGRTTRVQFLDPHAETESDSRAVFVDPVTGAVRGDLEVYGSSGALPFRTTVDKLHRGLLLGEPGRIYSETAASWMWILAVGGLLLWWPRLRARRQAGRPLGTALRESTLPGPQAQGRNRLAVLHSGLGLALLAAMVFLSATGITWSAHAGEHVSSLREALGWQAPVPETSLSGAGTASGEHAEHHGMSPGAGSGAAMPVDRGYDAALAAARTAGVESPLVEIASSPAQGTAWTVRETDPHFPTHVNSASVDPSTGQVVDTVDFQKDYSLPAKLARWGIDIHMGLWWGLANQVLLFLVALGLAAMVVLGYRMWFARRPSWRRPRAPRRALPAAPWWGWLAVGVPAAAAGAFLPLFGIPLLLFVAADALLWLRSRRRTPGAS